MTPVAVAVDEHGTVYVADTGRGGVVRFSGDGSVDKFLKPESRDGYRPIALCLCQDRLWAADASTSIIDVFAAESGRILQSFPLASVGGGVLPMGVACDGAGGIWVSDMVGGRILHIGADGAIGPSFGKRGDRYGDFGQPRHIAQGPDGVVFVADAEFGVVQLYDDAGKLLMLLGDSVGGTDGAPMPVSVAVANTLPEHLMRLVPDGFEARYFLFVAGSGGPKPLSLFAIGGGK